MASIHILTNTHLQSRFTHLQLAKMAFAGGADVVQYRNKSFEPGRDLAELQAICQLPRRATQHVLINDDPQLAKASHANGAHVGIEDMAPAQARAILPPPAILGATVHNLTELAALEGQLIDYIGVGPVFGTTSKEVGLPPLGLAGLSEICKASPYPVIAIGNITRANARATVDAGAAGVAILSEFCTAQNPQAVVEELVEILR